MWSMWPDFRWSGSSDSTTRSSTTAPGSLPGPLEAFRIVDFAGITADTADFDIEAQGLAQTWNDHPASHVWFTKAGAEPLAAGIVAVADNGDRTERVTIDVSTLIDDTWQAWPLHYVRLAQDVEQGTCEAVVRARFDTKRKTHPAGEGVFVVRLSDLARFPHRTSRPSTNYKLQPFTLQHERDLASIAPLPFTLAYRARRPFYPLNLRVNGDGRTPTYGAGAGVSVNWDRSDPRRNAEGPTETLTPAISRTVVELLTVGGVLKQTFAFAPTGPQTITNAQIVAALGAETDFVLRAWFESGGRRSLESDQITVQKV